MHWQTKILDVYTMIKDVRRVVSTFIRAYIQEETSETA
jgi:hypothetical protein